MQDIINYALFAFTSFTALINPLSVTTVFLTMSTDLNRKQQRRTALRAVITAFITLTVFAFAGQLLFKFFGISVNGFRIAGGIIFFIMGYDMLNARLSRIKYSSDDFSQEMNDVSITPLGIPLIAGPGAITNSIVLMEDAGSNPMLKIALPIAIAVVLLLTYLGMIAGTKVMKFFGETGNKIILKLMGLIMMVIAVEFFFAGLKPILRSILNIAYVL